MPNPITVLRKNIAINRHLARHDGAFVHRGLRLSIPDTVKRDVRHMIVSGDYENEEFELASKWVPKDRPVIELGGCLGVVSAHLRRTINPDQPLIVVEANPNIIETCRSNASRPAPDSPTDIICGAIAYGVEEVAFHLRRNLHVSRIADQDAEANFVCPAYTLSQLAARFGDHTFTLVCDIEGGEYDLFRKDGKVLKRCDLAIIETHPQMSTGSASKNEQLLADAEAAGLKQVDAIGDVIVLKRM